MGFPKLDGKTFAYKNWVCKLVIDRQEETQIYTVCFEQITLIYFPHHQKTFDFHLGENNDNHSNQHYSGSYM